MRILVTGGAGFIGSSFIRYMLNKYPSYTIINLDALTYAGNLDNLKDIRALPNYYFVNGDICNQDTVREIFESGVDVLVNFSAESHVDRSILDPGIFVRTNILGTQVLLDVAKAYGLERFVQVSTDEVYGTLGPTGFFTEETPLSPNSPYSSSKAAADLMVRAYFETYKLPVNITRCSNNYGPYQFPEKLIPLMILNAFHGKPLPVYGDGLQIRDWLHVEDHCRALDLVIHSGRVGEVYNVGGSNERTNLEIVKIILQALERSESLIQFVADRPGHDRRYAIDSSKLKRELGWEPTVSFQEGIVQTVDWYMSNAPWWQWILSGHYREYNTRSVGDAVVSNKVCL